LCRTVGKQLPLHGVQYLSRTKLLCTSQRKPEVTEFKITNFSIYRLRTNCWPEAYLCVHRSLCHGHKFLPFGTRVLYKYGGLPQYLISHRLTFLQVAFKLSRMPAQNILNCIGFKNFIFASNSLTRDQQCLLGDHTEFIKGDSRPTECHIT
jgi:hypothetical protein